MGWNSGHKCQSLYLVHPTIFLKAKVGSKFWVPGIFLQVDAICEISAPTINPNSYCFSIGNPQQSPGVQPWNVCIQWIKLQLGQLWVHTLEQPQCKAGTSPSAFFLEKKSAALSSRFWMESSQIDENLLKWMKNGQIGWIFGNKKNFWWWVFCLNLELLEKKSPVKQMLITILVNNVVLIYRVLHPTHIHHMHMPNMR
jgi:hypothetical protein